jgi:subtilisin family serine protease
MRPSRPRLATTLVALVMAMALAPATTLAKSPPTLTPPGTDVLARNSWIVTLHDAADLKLAARMSKRAGGKVGLVYGSALIGFQFKGTAKAAAALRQNPNVASVEADRPIYLTETVPFGIERVRAWNFQGPSAFEAGFRGAGARIAVLDTGIDLDHPDLAASIDLASSKNCFDLSEPPTIPPNDGHGHGTHVSGTAAAPLNGEGVVGVAPEAELIAVKMFDDVGNSSEALSLCALNHVTALNTDANPDNDIDVANMSWGEHRQFGDCASDALHGAICRARASGAILVGGAGNEAVSAGDFVPAAFPEVISVSALSDFNGQPGRTGGCQWVPSLGWYECDDTLAFFSNHGPSVDVIAPGVNVYSTWTGGGYMTIDGTSMATPHVTGVVALMAAADPDLTPAEALDVLRMTGECPNGQFADGDGTAGCAGQGTWPDDPDGIPEPLPNALRAAEAVSGTPPPPPPDPTAPGAPSLTDAVGGATAITLSWTEPADNGSAITGYEVWRGTVSGDLSLLTTVGDVQTYVDSAVVSGTTYWYQVAAINGIGVGPRSNELSASLVEPPSAPTLLGAPSDGAAILSWTEPADDGGSAVSSYNVYRSIGGGSEAFLASTTGAETTYVDFAVTNGTQYTYRVTASNGAGEGPYSNAVTVTPAPPNQITAPDPPQSLTAAKAAGKSSAIILTWAAPADDGGSPIASYFVYRRGPGETSFTLIDVTTALTYTDASVAKRSLYTYYVTAFNSYYESGHSNEVTIRTK